MERVILRCTRGRSQAASGIGSAGGDGAAWRRSDRGGAGGGGDAVARDGGGFGRKEELSSGIRRALPGLHVGGAGVFGVLHHRLNIPDHAPLEIPPEALAFHAREILNQLGYAAEPKDTGYGFDYVDRGYVRYLNTPTRHGSTNCWQRTSPR